MQRVLQSCRGREQAEMAASAWQDAHAQDSEAALRGTWQEIRFWACMVPGAPTVFMAEGKSGSSLLIVLGWDLELCSH